MVVRVLVAVVLTTAVFSSAAFSASPLHELDGTPGPTLVCGNVVVHANAAIAATLHADDTIAHSVAELHSIDFDVPGAARKRVLGDLAAAANDIRQSADRAGSETQRLRGFADHPAGQDRKADLDALAEQIDAALDQQRQVAHALDAFIGGVAYRSASSAAASTTAVFASSVIAPVETEGIGGLHPTGYPAASLPTASPATPSPGNTTAARTTASALGPRITEIEADEARAASHSESAIGGC